jgi:hypothetical protein
MKSMIKDFKAFEEFHTWIKNLKEGELLELANKFLFAELKLRSPFSQKLNRKCRHSDILKTFPQRVFRNITKKQ